jgi:hypothetical protein
MKALRLLTMVALLAAAVPLWSADLYVATDGDDGHPGTLAEPWRTIQHAVTVAAPGDTVQVRGGIYEERVTVQVSGTVGNPVTFRSFVGETAILDGTNLAPPVGDSAMLWIEGRSHIVIQGFEIRNYRTASNQCFPVGIMVFGAGAGVELRDNLIHHIEQNTAASAGSANGIGVYGTDGATPISGLIIAGNTIRDCRTGDSETLTLNGNVSGFEITGNTVRDCNNIGIDAIGWEGTAPANDQARDGIISGNVVHGITSFGNPAYGNERSAGGIYIDGGRDIVIERNLVHHCDLGIEVGCEHAGKTTSGITVRNNLLYFNHVAGLAFGGYDAALGTVTGCTFRHNTFFGNDTTASDTGEVMIQKANGNTFSHNLLHCRGNPYGEGAMVFSNWFSAAVTHDNAFDYNLYFVPGGLTPVFVWQNQDRVGLAAYRAASGQDAHAVAADPLLADPVTPDLHLLLGSPAVDVGDPAFVAEVGEADIDGDLRVINGTVDIGADEYDFPVLHALTVNQGTGSGQFAPGTRRTIVADHPAYAMQFAAWTGDTVNLDQALSATTIVTMPDADLAVTATFAPLAGTYVAPGSVVTVTAVEAGLADFARKPKVQGVRTWTDDHGKPRAKAYSLKVLTKVPDVGGNPVLAVSAEWAKAIRLHDGKAFKAACAAGVGAVAWLADHPVDPLALDLRVYDPASKATAVLAEPLQVLPPAITAVEDAMGNPLAAAAAEAEIVVKGEYFGKKPPKSWLEYEDVSGRIKARKCKTVKPLAYLDVAGKPACMPPGSGGSELRVRLPKLPADWDHLASHDLVLDNGVGLAAQPFGTLAMP